MSRLAALEAATRDLAEADRPEPGRVAEALGRLLVVAGEAVRRIDGRGARERLFRAREKARFREDRVPS